MSDYIERDDVTRFLDKYCLCAIFLDGQEAIKQLITRVDEIPAADVSPVVRCKDCKWYVEDREFPPFCDNTICGMQHPNDETFCSYGERRDDD